MNLLFDQNLSPRLPAVLMQEFPGSAHVGSFGLATAPDPAVWTFAAAGGFTVVSKDTDFAQRALLLGHPPKVIWLRISNCATPGVVTLLKLQLAAILSFLADPTLSVLALA